MREPGSPDAGPGAGPSPSGASTAPAADGPADPVCFFDFRFFFPNTRYPAACRTLEVPGEEPLGIYGPGGGRARFEPAAGKAFHEGNTSARAARQSSGRPPEDGAARRSPSLPPGGRPAGVPLGGGVGSARSRDLEVQDGCPETGRGTAPSG